LRTLFLSLARRRLIHFVTILVRHDCPSLAIALTLTASIGTRLCVGQIRFITRLMPGHGLLLSRILTFFHCSVLFLSTPVILFLAVFV
jgi:hypothetical protein